MTPTNRPQTREAAPLPAKDYGAARKQKGSSGMSTSPTRSIPRSAAVGQVAAVAAGLVSLGASLAAMRSDRRTRRLVDVHAHRLHQRVDGHMAAMRIVFGSPDAEVADSADAARVSGTPEGGPALVDADERLVDDVLVGSRLWEETDGTMSGSLAVGDEQLTGMSPGQMREALAQLAEMVDTSTEGGAL